MFYSQFILAKKGPLGTIWIAAHLERKLKKNQVADTDIGDSVDSILFPDVPIALRLSSHLLLGVVRIYSRKVNYLFHDCSEALLKVKQAFRSTAVDLPPEESTAPYHSITLPETFDLDDFELPDSALNGNFDDRHVSSREQITLQDSLDGTGYSTLQFGLDERFGDGDASQIGLDLDEELLLDNNLKLQHDSVSYGDEHKGEGASDLTKIDMDEAQLGCDEDRTNEASKALSELLCNDRGKHVISDVQNVNRIDDSSHRLVFNIRTPDLNEAFLPDNHIGGSSGAHNIDMDFSAAAAAPSPKFNELANIPSTPISVNCQEHPVSNPQEILPYTDSANGELEKPITQEVECPDATNENLVNATLTDPELNNVAQTVSPAPILDELKSDCVAPQYSGGILASLNPVNDVQHIHNNSKDAADNGNLVSIESTYPKMSEVTRVLPSGTSDLTEAVPDSVVPPCSDGTVDTPGLTGLESILGTTKTSRAGIVGNEANDLPVPVDNGNPFEDAPRLSNLDQCQEEYEDTARLSNLDQRQVEFEDTARLSNLGQRWVTYEDTTRLSNLDQCRDEYDHAASLSNLGQRQVEYEETARLSNLEQHQVAYEDTARLSNLDQHREEYVDTNRLSNLDQRRLAYEDAARLSNRDQRRLAYEDAARLSNRDQRGEECKDTAKLSNLDQRREEYEDTARLSNLDQHQVAYEDTARLSSLDERQVAYEDSARLSNLDQHRVAYEDASRLSNLVQRPEECEDTARLLNLDQCREEYVDTSRFSYLDQRKVEYEDTARLSSLDQRGVAYEDAARLSDLDQQRVAYEDAARSSNLNQHREEYEDAARLSNLDQRRVEYEDTARLTNLDQRRVEEAHSYQTNNFFALSSDFQMISCTSGSNQANLISPGDMLLKKTPGFFSRDQPCNLERPMVDQELHFSGFSVGLQGFPSVAIDTNLGSPQKSNDIQLGRPNCFSSSEFSEPERMLFAPSGNVNLSSDFRQQTIEKVVIESDGRVDRISNLCGQKRHLVDNTPESQNGISPNVFGIPRKKQNTDYIIPRDDDLLASILVGRRTPALKMGPTPPLPKPPPSKRPRSTQKVGLPKRRKVLLDDTIVLHADAIRQQLMNTEDIRRMRRKAPCTRPEIWRIQKSFVEVNIFCESIFIGISDELNSLLSRRYDTGQNIHAQAYGHHSNGDTIKEFEVCENSPLARDNEGREVAVQSAVVTERVDGEIQGASCGELIDAESCQKAVSILVVSIDAQEKLESPFEVPFDSKIEENRNNGLADAEHNSMNKEFQTSHQIVEVSDNAPQAADLVSFEEFTSADCVDVKDGTSVQVEDLSNANAASITVEDMDVDIVNVTSVDRLQDEQVGMAKDHSDGASASMLDKFMVEVGADFPEDSSTVFEHANSSAPDIGMACGGDVVDGEKAASEVTCGERPNMASFPVPPCTEGERVPSAVGENSGMNAEGGLDVESTPTELAATRESSDFCSAVDDVDTDFLNVDDEAEYDEETFDDAPNTEAQSLENSGWSSRTRGVARYLKTMFDRESGRGKKSVAVDHLLTGKTRKEASRMFFETLVLETRGYIQVEQDNPFSCINIKPRIKLLKTEF